MKRLAVIFAALALTLTAQTEWYAAVDGKTIATGGNGSEANPWDLNTALRGAGGAVKPGDTIWLKGGVYKGRYASTLAGTASAPIKVRAVAGQRVTIDGFVITATTSVIPSGNAGTYAAFNVASGTGFSANLPNDHMSVLVEYTPSGSSVPVEESMRLIGADPTRLFVYRGACRATAGACPSVPIGSTVRAQSDYLKVAGAYTWFMGIEVMLSQATHVYGTGATNPPWPNFQGAIADRCNGCKYINMVIHDSGANGIFSGAPGIGTEFYGNLIYYNGVDQLGGRGHGHGIYTQNTLNGATKSLIDNFFFRSFGHGNQIYGTSAARLDNFHVEGNTYFNPGEPATVGKGGSHFIIGDAGVFRGHVFKDNMSYGGAAANVDIGYGGSAAAPECTSPAITGNYLINRAAKMVAKVTCATPVITGNTFFGALAGFVPANYPTNSYLKSLTGQMVFVRPNKYEAGRANITIFNWANLDAASVDLSRIGLVDGDNYEVRDVQNWHGPPVATGVLKGSTITVPLTGTAVTQPIGTIAVPPIVHTPKEFNAFVVMKVAGGSNPCPCAPPTSKKK